MTTTREYLRALPVFAGDLPEFDPESTPDRPEALFIAWLGAAVAAGVREPHAMTLSTLGTDGVPSARVLILKNVDADGWQFAVHGGSPKGRDLIEHPSAALTFYWSSQARQIRVRGRVVAEPAERSAADFLARPVGSRAETMVGRQSRPLSNRQDLELATKQNVERIKEQPDLVVPEWTLYTLRPDRVEFWQGDKQRKHTRVSYLRKIQDDAERSIEDGAERGDDADSDVWTKQLLWP